MVESRKKVFRKSDVSEIDQVEWFEFVRQVTRYGRIVQFVVNKVGSRWFRLYRKCSEISGVFSDGAVERMGVVFSGITFLNGV